MTRGEVLAILGRADSPANIAEAKRADAQYKATAAKVYLKTYDRLEKAEAKQEVWNRVEAYAREVEKQLTQGDGDLQ